MLFVQCVPVAHTTPHPPQFASLTFVLTHTPEQYELPLGHLQAPFWQVEPPVHKTPHAPQLPLLVVTSTHVPLHSTLVPAQAHCAFVQSCPARHAAPQLPQLKGSLDRSTQRPAQFVAGARHEVRHCPPEQAVPVAQIWLHPPQF